MGIGKQNSAPEQNVQNSTLEQKQQNSTPEQTVHDSTPEQINSTEESKNPDDIPNLSEQEMKDLRESMHNLPSEIKLEGLTNKDIDKLKEMCKIDFKIGSDDPQIREVLKRAYPLHPKMERLLDIEISDQMKNGLLIATTTGNRSPCLAIPKNPDQTNRERVRLLSDYRCLNINIVNQSWPLPSFSDILNHMAQHKPKYLSTMDIFSGYSQVKL